MTRQFTYLLLLLSCLVSVRAQYANLSEMKYGYGGFAVRAGTPSEQNQVAFQLDEYQVWGNAFLWNGRGYELRVLVCTATKQHFDPTKNDKSAVFAKWRAVLFGTLGKASTLKEKPLVFSGFTGTEITADLPRPSLTRLFYLNNLIVQASVVVSDKSDLLGAQSILDSFRPLTKTERAAAIIDEFAPPTLAQERPRVLPTAETTELGLIGPVRRIRDSFVASEKFGPVSERHIEGETHFDREGFVLMEISFRSDFPDLITTWGWKNGKRTNLQSPVTYPPGDGPPFGRTTVVSGSFSIPGTTYVAKGAEFGNLIDVKRDASGRAVEKRRYASSGSLVYVEHYTYSGDRVEVRTTDDSGGFMGRVRNRLDDYNNVLETETLMDNGGRVSTTVFKYEFDERGNWIVKRAYKPTGAGRRAALKPVGAYYRSISYYADDLETRQLS